MAVTQPPTIPTAFANATTTGNIACQHARHDQVCHWIVCQRLERIDLLGHAHGPDLGGNIGTHPPGQREAGEHRAEFEDHRLGDEHAHEVQRYGARERVRRLQREDDAGERRDEQRDRQ
jgi:hypothetical protein